MSTGVGVGLLQHYFKRYFTCDIFPLRYELENLSTTDDAKRAGLQLSSWVDGRPMERATVKCSLRNPNNVPPQPPVNDDAVILIILYSCTVSYVCVFTHSRMCVLLPTAVKP